MASEFPNSGALFKADAAKKRENPKRPDYEGSAEVDGVDYWISAWLKEGKSGKFMSLAFKPKEQRKSSREPGDDIPW
jgi:hypothetical protein